MRHRFTIGATALVATALLTGAAFIASPADAARGGASKPSGGTASISLQQSAPRLGDSVTFATSGGSRIAVACYQGGVGNMVWSVDQATGTTFVLGGTNSEWSTVGGEALCYAWLYKRSMTRDTVASISFTAGG